MLADIHASIAQLLHRTVRESDYRSRTDDGRFRLAAASKNPDASWCFAQRMCHAIETGNVVADPSFLIVNCGMASLAEAGVSADKMTFQKMRELAQGRPSAGFARAIIRVVGREEEAAFQRNDMPFANEYSAAKGVRHDDSGSDPVIEMPPFTTLLQWLREGRL